MIITCIREEGYGSGRLCCRDTFFCFFFSLGSLSWNSIIDIVFHSVMTYFLTLPARAINKKIDIGSIKGACARLEQSKLNQRAVGHIGF